MDPFVNQFSRPSIHPSTHPFIHPSTNASTRNSSIQPPIHPFPSFFLPLSLALHHKWSQSRRNLLPVNAALWMITGNDRFAVRERECILRGCFLRLCLPIFPCGGQLIALEWLSKRSVFNNSWKQRHPIQHNTTDQDLCQQALASWKHFSFSLCRSQQ